MSCAIGSVPSWVPFVLARVARRWVRPFPSVFPDFDMELGELIRRGPEGGRSLQVLGHAPGDWLGVPGTGRRFEGVDEIYIFEIGGGELVSGLDVEDNLSRMRQIVMYPET